MSHPSAPGVAGAPLVVRDALAWAVRLLAQAGVDGPRLDSELLLGHVLGLDRVGLRIRWDAGLAHDEIARFSALVRRRASREPLAYLVGTRAFFGLDLYVAPGVLVPRPETERLVEEALAWCASRSGRSRQAAPLRGADVGTGSGAIAVALAHHCPGLCLVAVDLSPQALRVARQNALLYGVERQVLPVRGDLLSPVAGALDLIVSNPPYIPHERLSSLMPEVRDHEPRLALDGGAAGLEVIRQLLSEAPERLGRPGLLLVEIDEGQGHPLMRLARQTWPAAEVRVLRDLAGLERVLRVELL